MIGSTTDGIYCHCCYRPTDEMMVSLNEVNECISRLECNLRHVGWTALVLST